MSIFGNILARIFPSSHPAVVATAAPASSTAGSLAGSAPAAPVPAAPGSAAAVAPAVPTPTPTPAAGVAPVDVDAVISAMPGASALNWRTSIVDLLKVLGLDSSLDSRKQLAHELGYSGSTQDSAAMNIWLHKEVVAKLAANGGKVPDAMKS